MTKATTRALLAALVLWALAACDGGGSGAEDTGGDETPDALTGGEDATTTPSDVPGTPDDVPATPDDVPATPDDIPAPLDVPLIEEDTGEPPPVLCTLTGVVQDGDGAPVEGLRVVLCDETVCYTDQSTAEGRFTIADHETKDLTLKMLGSPKGLIGVSMATPPCETRDVDVGAVRLPALPDTGPEVMASGGGRVEVLPGLFITFPADLQFPGFEDSQPILAVRLDPTSLHPLLTDQVPEPLAVWAFEPYGTKGPEPIGFEVKPETGDTTFQVYGLNHETGVLVSLFQVTADADGVVASPPGEGLPELSWLVLGPAN